MGKQPTGQEIVAAIANGRPWWRLTAGDVQPWIKSLHSSALQDNVGCIACIGEPWDGVSDIDLGGAAVSSSDIALLISKLRRGIKSLGVAGIALPDATSVRRCVFGSGSRQSLAVDIALTDFILPLRIDDWVLRSHRETSFAKIASSMLGIITHAQKVQVRLGRREQRLRKALEETTARIGEGVAPMWLRMEPFPFDADPIHLRGSSYQMVMVMLDHCLAWSPKGYGGIDAVKDVRDFARRGISL